MREFDYVRADTVDRAVTLLSQEGARPLAGGTDLIPQMREGRRTAATIVDLKHIPELVAITDLPDGGLSIGAAAKASVLARDPRVLRNYPAVASSSCLIGSLQVQNRASLGGNICNAAPSADGVPALLAHGAKALIAGPNGRREMPLEALFQGPGRTTLAAGEILVAILLPPNAPRSAAHYLRFTPRREMDIAVVGAGTWIHLDADDRVVAARIFLASVGPTPIRATTAEAALVGAIANSETLREAGRCAGEDAKPISDTRGSMEYRRTLSTVLTMRALGACCRALGTEVETP